MAAYSIEIKKELLTVLYTNIKHGWLGYIILWFSLFLAYGFPNIPATYFFSCAALCIALTLYLHCQRFVVSEIKNNPKTIQYWINRASLLSLIQGGLVGLSPWLMLDLTSPSTVFLITSIIMITSYGSAVVSGSSKIANLSWSLSSILPLASFLILSDVRDYQIMAILIVFMGIPISIFLNLYVYNLFTEMIQLKYENLDLLKDNQKQRKIAEKENSEKSRFIASTSHDLRQPLYALNLYLGVLETKLSKSEHNHLILKAQHASQALNDLFNSLMDMSQLDADLVKTNLTVQNLSIIINELMIELEPLTIAKNIIINCQIEPAYIKTDTILFIRIVRNLAMNAIEHNEDCNILISSKNHFEHVVIKIQDTGKGIAMSEQENIFSEFYQLNNPERNRNKGLGLGLAIVKRLTKLLNIQIQIESQIGKGTCFSLILEKEQQTDIVLKKCEPIQFDLSGLFIMVVEDDEMVADALRSLLRSWECEVLIAKSEQQLISEIKEGDYALPDFIISDYRLQKNKNGGGVIKAVRRFYKQTIPAVIISGDTTVEIKERINELSCELLTKPLKSQELKEVLKKIK